MIASPDDVPNERRVVRDVVHEWNAVHAEKEKLVLMPIGWESHSVPEMGERPQGIINRQLLEGCDLLVGVFWTRLGSPTGKAESGTVEEIREHLDRGRPAMLYFSSAPVRPDSVDNDQYTALTQFKEECRQLGLVEEFDSTSEFRETFARQLAQSVIKDFNVSVREDLATPGLPAVNQVECSDDAKQLLLEASKDKGGVIMKLGTMTNSHVQTNGLDFIESPDARTVARWRGAVDELEALGLIEDRAGKGEIFFMTNEGFNTAERIVPER